MLVYSSMSNEDFIAQLRTIAINAGAGPLVINAIDKLERNEKVEELEERVEELERELACYQARAERHEDELE